MQFSDISGLTGYTGLVGSGFSCLLIIFISLYSILRKDSKTNQIIPQLTLIQLILLFVSVLSVVLLLALNAFEYPLVFDAIERDMPVYQKMSGLWSSQAGSLLFWSFIMNGFIFFAVKKAKGMKKWQYVPLISLILEFILLFFLAPVIFITNPFEKFWMLSSGMITSSVFTPEGASLVVPVDGPGMNPALRHPAMLLHPPFLYLGLNGFFIPYAFSLASLILNDLNHMWAEKVYRIVIFSWICLTIGMVLGSWWAYTILGWGGYWGWDAVEISGLLPWLLSFGLIHALFSLIRKGTLSKWVYGLSIIIVLLILFGILITRSGIIESVHAYATGAVGPVLTLLIAINLAVSLYFLIRRWRNFPQGPVASSLPDRLMRLFNWLLVGVVVLYLFGQTLPITSRLFLPEQRTLLPTQYERYSAPFLFLLVIITGLHPIADLYHSNRDLFKKYLVADMVLSTSIPILLLFYQEFSIATFFGFWSVSFLLVSWMIELIRYLAKAFPRKKERTAGLWDSRKISSFLIHFGFGLLALGILGTEALAIQDEIVIEEGERYQGQGILVEVEDREEEALESGETVYMLNLQVEATGFKSGQVQPMMHFYPKLELTNSVPAFASNFLGDVQFIIHDWERPLDQRAVLQMNIFPLINWIWMGALLMSLGGVIVLCRGRTHTAN